MQSDENINNIPKYIDLYLDHASEGNNIKLDNAGDAGYANYKSAVSESCTMEN